MKLSYLKYFLAYSGPLSVLLSFYYGGYMSFFSIFYAFVLVPAGEFFFQGTTENLSEEEEERVKNSLFFDVLVYSMIPVQYGLLYLFLEKISAPGLLMYEKAGFTVSMGLSSAILGINVAHELGHRSKKYEQFMSKMLLLTSLYMHFFIEHNRGHHKNVSTDEDPASSRYGETLYAFYIRSVRDSWFSAWKLESDRLRRAGLKFWSIDNEMLMYQFIQAAFLGLIVYVWGWQTMIYFSISAVLGFLMLESVNYIEHYGLKRKKINDKAYERTMPVHSWNSNHSVGRILLFELTRHSDHHYMASRKYQILRHFEEAPQMPTGYPGMMVLALFPPLWFKVMHKQIEKYRKTREGEALA